ncbi:bifunctional nuclease family protein [Prevotella dentasini]
MDKVQLFFRGVTEIVGEEGIGLLILADRSEARQVAIVCDGPSEYQIGIRLNKAPNLETLLPETLCRLVPRMDAEHYEIFFSSINNGQYKALLTDKATAEAIPVRASDAVLLSLIARLDIFMERHLFDVQSVSMKKDNSRMALPVNALDDVMLQKALERAIANENYELASYLRDEIRQRQG